MHLPISKNNIIFCAIILICTLVFTIVITAALFTVSDAVTYHPITDNADVSVGSNYVTDYICTFDDSSLIPDTGPFLIRYDKDGIYVFSGKERLYRVKTQIENFPKADKNAIICGISAKTQNRLFELIEYMES